MLLKIFHTMFYLFTTQNAAFASSRTTVKERAMNAGREVAMQYRELLQMVMHGLNKPSSDNKQQLGNISRKIAQCVTDLATAAQQLKDDDWVDPSDPTFVAETELLGAAKSIENAARKLSSLKPRKEIKGKVRKTFVCVRKLIIICVQFHEIFFSTKKKNFS